MSSLAIDYAAQPQPAISTSNQSQTIIKTDIQDQISSPETIPTPTVSIPFIDKITLTLAVPDPLLKAVVENIRSVLKMKLGFQEIKLPRSPYKINCMIPCENTSERVLFQCLGKNSKVPGVRIEFNPNKMGWIGVQSLDSTLLWLLPEECDGWSYVRANARVSRVDVSVDVAHLRMDEFMFLPTIGLIQQRFRRDGHLETVYFGKRGANQLKIYDKRLEQKSKGLGIVQTVRIEQTLRNTGLKLCELGKLKNPFSKIALKENFPPPPTGEKPWQWSTFEDSVQVRGLASALGLIPAPRRTTYRKHLLKYHQQKWWDPDATWKNFPLALEPLS